MSDRPNSPLGGGITVETEAKIEYESPAIVDYGDFAALTAGQLHDPLHSGPYGGPHHDPHLTFSAG